MGFMAIYAGAPMAALIMGAVTECAKIMTTSWLYRNWSYASWKLKIPLLYFLAALMVATSIGVFGFLSKAHLEQGANTIDNAGKIEDIARRIDREKALIADNEKVIAQLDATVNSFLGKDRLDKSLAVRKSQAPQRKQLTQDSADAQKRIDTLSEEKFKLESEVRKLQLDVGPIRYIADLFYGPAGDSSGNIEAAVRIFTLLIVSTLDPLAVTLIIAANATLTRLRNEKEKTFEESFDKETPETPGPVPSSKPLYSEESSETNELSFIDEEKAHNDYLARSQVLEEIPQQQAEILKYEEKNPVEEEPEYIGFMAETPVNSESDVKVDKRSEIQDSESMEVEGEVPEQAPIVRPWAHQTRVLHELVGNSKHFVPERVIPPVEKTRNTGKNRAEDNKYHKAHSWLAEFRGR